jgi:tetratricopeptide (TPR) repeat protein
VEIVSRGKDRVEKSGEADANIDSDSTVLRTSAEAIRLLCRFGSRHEAEKALEIGHSIERWLDQSEHIRSSTHEGSAAASDTLLEPAALAAAYCAIGISQAHWARHTYDVELRADIQAKAVQYLRKALSPSLSDSHNIEALYALALVLAEMRDIPGAVKVVKRALSPPSASEATVSTDGVLSGGLDSEYGRERKLIPLWHLLALLLTSRGDFSAAEKACEAAFEQFGGSATLFGSDDKAYHSEHLNQNTGNHSLNLGVVDRMECFEKSSVLQIKMTQLALMETLEGSLYAVDGCDELLALYSRLFGDPAGEKVASKPPTTSMPPPKSAIGTVRGSMFRGRGSVKTPQKDLPTRTSSVLSSRTSATQSGAAPAIQVTEDDGTTHGNGHHRHHLFHHHKNDETQAGVVRSASKLRKRTSASPRRQSISEADRALASSQNAPNGSPVQTQRQSNEAGEQPLRAIPHNMANASPHEHMNQPPKQDIRLPAPAPHSHVVRSDPRFSKIQERRQKVSLLVDIWLFISGLYSRAQMFQDAREAVAEALKLVDAFELEVSQESSTAKTLSTKGWGGGKSVEELWADAFAAVSIPSLMKHNPC